MTDVRTGGVAGDDALPLALHRWLRDALRLDAPPVVTPLASRSRNRTYRVVAGVRAYTLKLVPSGRAHALAHEAAITAYLHGQGFPVPRTVATATLPGLMETATLRTFLPGAPAQATYDAATPPVRAVLAAMLGSLLARVHALPLDVVRDLWQYPEDTVTAPREWATNFVQKKIADDLDRIAPALPDAVRTPFVEEVTAWGAWLAAQPVPLAPLHGDYYLDNVLLDGGRVTAVLDWEAARLGDPLWDLARTQAAAFTDDLTAFSRFHDAYRERVPWPVDDTRVLRYRLLMAMGDLRYAVRHAPALIPARVPPVLALWQRCLDAKIL